MTCTVATLRARLADALALNLVQALDETRNVAERAIDELERAIKALENEADLVRAEMRPHSPAAIGNAFAPIECPSAVIVTFSFDDGTDSVNIRFCVPENLFWYADGLRYLFDVCRESFLSPPGADGFDENSWESWHLVAVENPDCSVVLGISSLPPFPCLKERNTMS